jgi:hypothetical protein
VRARQSSGSSPWWSSSPALARTRHPSPFQPGTDNGSFCTSRSILEPEAPPEAQKGPRKPNVQLGLLVAFVCGCHTSAMAVDDASDTVTICQGQGLFLHADTAGLLIRGFHFGRARWIAWSEISSFADGRYTKQGVTSWVLVIVLRTGKEVPVLCSVLGDD